MSRLSLEIAARANNRPTMWEMKGEKIKPCPFCGSIEISLVEDDWMHWCTCLECGVEGPVRDTRLHAIERWQKRKYFVS